ncbi:MAG: lytic transglycosylase domain-containing protein [Clostridiales bacterium]|nr:lytic transglycosylase domain-containing protein [Clostridiales bacterium]
MKFGRKLIPWLLVLALAAGLVSIGYQRVMKAVYPKEYQELVERYSRQNQLEPALVYAVIKCESSFDPNAVSSADAKGLMQLTDETFAWVQTKDKEREKGAEALPPDRLFDPETNIRYGTLLLSLHKTEFASDRLALAAYHAGRGIVNKWLDDETYTDDGESLHTVPYAETNAYIDKVIKTKAMYEKLYGKGE